MLIQNVVLYYLVDQKYNAKFTAYKIVRIRYIMTAKRNFKPTSTHAWVCLKTHCSDKFHSNTDTSAASSMMRCERIYNCMLLINT